MIIAVTSVSGCIYVYVAIDIRYYPHNRDADVGFR